jgi:nucleoside-triphosphatase THEP1
MLEKSRQSRKRQKIKGFLTTEVKEGTARKAGGIVDCKRIKNV